MLKETFFVKDRTKSYQNKILIKKNPALAGFSSEITV